MIKPFCRDSVVLKKKRLGDEYFSLTFGPLPRIGGFRPGHFIQLQLPGTDLFFRRPMSVAGIESEPGKLDIVFRVVGRGTLAMSRLRSGDSVNILGPLGTPFKLPRRSEAVALVAGGVGIPPLLFLARVLITRGFDPKKIVLYYGGRTAADIIMRSQIKKSGIQFCPVTEDGSFGTRGLVTAPIMELLQNIDKDRLRPRLFACGPQGMLKAVNELGIKYGVSGQLSLEAPMPCGVGICLGCVVSLTEGGQARVCKEGPVFDIGEVML
ncbi:MAG: dihydroorotate dehydrogenase electron transfer subunit [candidate division Zixibacteria bacterium]|nr:dihydroorotate dehydrogenase electron transfer subunit [candidate division Zixibacteria bacterium]